ncbi:hypothetical protein ABBQ32_004868 [Trebouxia sp. C0010 RCD-2024]
MCMPGGGILGVGPGQITDDSELALCLAHALVATGQARSHDQSQLQSTAADMYCEWLNSRPFDLGMATRHALSGGLDARQDGGSKTTVAAAVIKSSADSNMESKANGALMRITPLAVWAHQLPQEQLVQTVRADAQLTHPNQTCQDCNACYCSAIAHLIRHPGDAPGAVKAAETWASQGAVTEVQEWLADSAQPGADSDCQKLIGFVKWGFTYAFRHLRLQSSYTEAISSTLLMGGDTDTNAAIVGGMIGALHGASSIPEYMKMPVLARGMNSPGIPRPAFLATDALPSICQQLHQLAGGSNTS